MHVMCNAVLPVYIYSSIYCISSSKMQAYLQYHQPVSMVEMRVVALACCVKQEIVEKMDMDFIIHVGLRYLSCVLLPGADSLEEGGGWADAGVSYFWYQSLLV